MTKMYNLYIVSEKSKYRNINYRNYFKYKNKNNKY